MSAHIFVDWQDRKYQVEVVFTSLDKGVSGYIVHVDDEPFREGEMFATHAIALQTIRDHLAGRGK